MSDLAPKGDIPTRAFNIAAKIALAQVPVAGPLLAEVFSEVAPSFQKARLEGFAEALGELLQDQAPEVLSLRVREPLRYDLLEEGLRQAARARSARRISEIASIVANGLTSEKTDLDRQYLLGLLSELNDVEVLLLCSEGAELNGTAGDFNEHHRDVLEADPPTFGAPQEVLDDAAIRDSYRDHLVRLGLLQEAGGISVDDHFRARGNYVELSILGNLLLREIGFLKDGDSV